MEGDEPAGDDVQAAGGAPGGAEEHRQETPAVRVQVQNCGRG